jgi:PKD repeat protein
MQKKLLLLPIVLFVMSFGLKAQGTITWTDSFFRGVPATAQQIQNWNDWRAKLQPGSYAAVIIQGSFDKSGKKCTDPRVVNDFARAIKDNTTYISTSQCGGAIWSICNRYLGEIWLDPPASCSGANCPSPGYIIRPGIGTGNSNWGGINTPTCGGDNQRMWIIFEAPSDAGVSNISLGTNTLCRDASYDLSFRLTNIGPGVINKEMSFRVESPLFQTFTETFDIKNFDSGRITTLTFDRPIKASTLGTNFSIKVTSLSVDDNPSNDVTETFVNVISTPTGSEIKPVGLFPGFPKQGTFFEKDVVTYGKQYSYEISNPTKYGNNQHNSAWISRFEILKNGSPLPGSRYTYSPPSTSSNARVTLLLAEEDVEAEIRIAFKVTDIAGNGCDTTATRYLYVAPMPKPMFEGTQVCLGSGLQFQNRSTINTGGMSFVWDFGDGSAKSTLYEPNYSYTAEGSYQVKLIATSLLGFVDSIVFTTVVHPTPTAHFEFENQCGSQPVSFHNKSSIGSGSMFYDWDFGNGSSSKLENPVITYSEAGPYLVTLLIETDNGCFATVTKSAYAYPQPHVAFNAPDQVCVGSEITFQNLTTIAFSNWGCEWLLPGNKRTLTRSPQYTFERAGPYPITLRVTTQFGCKDSMTQMVNAIPGPFIQMSHSDACVGSPVIFNSNIDAPKGMAIDYLWNIDGEIFGDEHPSALFKGPGHKWVSVNIVYENGCKGYAQKLITSGYKPKVDFSLGDAICAGVEVALENRTTTDFDLPKYKWMMGDGTVYADFAPQHTYQFSNVTPVEVMLIASAENNVCPDTMVKQVVVGIVPSCAFTIEETYLPGHRGFTFIPQQNGATYQWNFGDGSVSKSPNPTYQYKRDGLFTAKLQVISAEGCTCESDTMFSVINLSASQIFSKNQSIQVYPNPSQGVFNIQWSNAYQSIASIQVYNAIGEIVLSNQSPTIDLSDRAAGMYLIEVKDSDGMLHQQRVLLTK